MNPLSFFKGASAQFQLFVVCAVFIAGILLGWRVHDWKTDAGLYQSIASIEKTRQTDVKQAAKTVDLNEKTKEEIRYVYKTIYQKADNVSDGDNICFTSDSLRLWNESITAANRDRQKPAAKTETNESAESATVAEVLKNGIDNNEACALNNQNHNALIDRIESLDGKMCYCAK